MDDTGSIKVNFGNTVNEKSMTYFEAESIKQDFFVAMQFADIAGKTREEAYTETAKKYTSEKLAEALIVLLNDLEKETDTITALFALAIRTKEAV